MRTIFRKELADNFNSFRFLILLLLAILVSAATLYADYKGIRASAGSELIFLRLYTTQTADVPQLFSFMNFMALFFIPVIGIALGFDAIVGERASGTLGRILSQPIYRDSVINAKFLAGLVTLSVMVATTMLLIAGFGLRLIGVPPTQEEVYRLFLYGFFTIGYGAFWMGMAILFSVVFRHTATSLLSSVALWLFFGFFYIFLIAPSIANVLAPTSAGTVEAAINNISTQQALLRFSPNYVFLEVSNVLLQPPLAGSLMGIIGIIASGLASWMIPTPLSLGQTLLLVWPHLATILGLTIVSFGVSYLIFMRQEIRST
ncbi:MAG: ABC transporter permease subunit [Chloroflexota bacterium]